MADQNAAEAGCRIDRIDFHGWQAAKLSNGIVDLVAVPDVGGRIMAFDLGNYPFLWFDRNLAGKLFSAEENMGDGSIAAWKNYGGGKTWPAPRAGTARTSGTVRPILFRHRALFARNRG